MREGILLAGITETDLEFLKGLFSRDFSLVLLKNPDQPLTMRLYRAFALVIYDLGDSGREKLESLYRFIKSDEYERPVIVLMSSNSIESDRFLAATGVYYRMTRPAEFDKLPDLARGAISSWKKKHLLLSAKTPDFRMAVK